MDRIKQLQQFIAEDPRDPFNSYALALEYLKFDPSEAGRLFENLMMIHPEYLPVYYPYAQWLIERKENEKAESVFQKGILTAKAQHDHKALKEILAAYADWKYEMT